jgi:chromate transporter
VLSGQVAAAGSTSNFSTARAERRAEARLGIFSPAFVFVALRGPLVPRLRASPLAGAFLDGVNVASIGLMLG